MPLWLQANMATTKRFKVMTNSRMHLHHITGILVVHGFWYCVSSYFLSGWYQPVSVCWSASCSQLTPSLGTNEKHKIKLKCELFDFAVRKVYSLDARKGLRRTAFGIPTTLLVTGPKIPSRVNQLFFFPFFHKLYLGKELRMSLNNSVTT